MRVIFEELLPYSGHSSSFQAAVRVCTYYTIVVTYALLLLAAGLTLTRYSDILDSRLHVFVCATLGVVGTVCVVRCCQFSGRLLSTRGEWWNLWRRQAEALGVRFVVLAVAPPLAFGMLALYCLGRHGQHMAEENGSRWHGALFSYALIAPRMVEEIMITLLIMQILPVTRQWANLLTSSQKQAAMALVWWQILASNHNFMLAVLHDSHAHYVGLYLNQPEYLLLVYHCLLLVWALVLLLYVARSTPVEAVLQDTPVPINVQELVPGTDLVIDVEVYPPPMASLVGGAALLALRVPVMGAPGGEEEEEEARAQGDSHMPSHVVTDRVRRHSHKLLHKHSRYWHREFT